MTRSTLDFATRFAPGYGTLKPSAVREILKVADRPDILSFAGGLPAPELFPVEAMARAHEEVLIQDGTRALQYSTTEGHPALREWLVARLARRGIQSDLSRLLVTSGSQQGLDLITRVLVGPGDLVLVEDPTYLAALQVFEGARARVASVASDDEGILPDALEAALRKERPKFLYVVTDFSNPRGTSYPLARRRAIVELCRRYDTLILEDDPYGELRFRGTHLPPLAALDENVMYLGTFSKTLAPGLRIGWLHGPAPVVRAVTIAKQAADLHSGTLSQRAASKLLETFDYDAHMQTLIRVYGARCDAMLGALDQHMPEGARWTRPEGGLFLWMALPDGMKDETLFHEAVKRKVAFVPGSPFFARPNCHGHLRLNFSNRAEAAIVSGMASLGEAMREVQKNAPRPSAVG